MDGTLIRLKKFATLLPNYWLAETPQTLASRRLGRQSAERERISEINGTFYKKTADKPNKFVYSLKSYDYKLFTASANLLMPS
jgi:hypothetical protein